MRILMPLLLSLVAVARLSAQSILVTVFEEETGRPIQGALATLKAGAGPAARAALTDASGRFLFDGLPIGSYEVRVEMIGRQSVSFGPLSIADASTRLSQTLYLPAVAIELSRLLVEAERQCRLRPEQGLLTAQLWDEARKALEVARWGERHPMYRYGLRSYERDLDPGTSLVEKETVHITHLVASNPIRSLPPGDLAVEGYIRRLETGEYDYFAPDAEALLSNAFLDTHCLSVRQPNADHALVGLAFEPVRRSATADIEGVFWLRRSDARLDHVTFRYTSLPWPLQDERIGGEVHFERLPMGPWIVRRWAIRMPLVARDLSAMRNRSEPPERLVGIREAGQEITRIQAPDGTTLVTSTWASVEGSVWDSTQSTPLAGARVSLAETPYSAVTDSAGRYLLTQLPEGTYGVRLTHPRLDSMGAELPAVHVVLDRGRLTHLDLAVPSANTLWAAACLPLEEGQGVLIGTVRDASSGVEVPGAWVEMAWPGASEPRRAATDGRGRFRICQVAAGVPLAVRAGVAHLVADSARAAVPPGGYAVVSLDLPLQESALASDTSVRRDLGRRQLIRGRVTESQTGTAVTTALITIRDADGRTAATALSDEGGGFRVALERGGRYSLEAQALGYENVHAGMVDVGAGDVVDVEVRLQVRALTLEPMVVTVSRRSERLDRSGFYDRMGAPGGAFLTPERIERRNAHSVSDLLRGIPSVVVTEGSAGGSFVHFRGGERPGGNGSIGICWPRVIIDGVVVSPGGAVAAGLDRMIDPSRIEGMEVYRRPAELAAAYGGAQSACGVIVVWTKG